jgi:hypothetical protein
MCIVMGFGLVWCRAWENRPVLLKALVEGETEPAFFSTRKIVEIRSENTFDVPPQPAS